MKVDKGQMETSIKDDNMEAAAARRADMASVCTKLSCLCHHASLKVGRICALTSFALKPCEESFKKIGAFYGQGVNCCDKCGKDNKREANAINPATLYEVERLLNMLRPDYLNPDNTYPHIHVMCRRFLLESLRNAQMPHKKLDSSSGGHEAIITQVEGPGRKKPALNKASKEFEALSPHDVQERQALLAKLRMQNVANLHPNPSPLGRSPSSHTKSILGGGKKDHMLSHPPGRASQQQKQNFPNPQEVYLSRLQQQLEKQGSSVNLAQAKSPTQHTTMLMQQQHQTVQTQQVSQIIQLALKKDPVALQQISKTAPAAVVQAIASMMKGTNVKSVSQRQPQLDDPQSSLQEGGQSLPTVSTLLRPPTASSLLPQIRQQPVPRKYPRPQLYAQPIIVSTAANTNMSLPHSRFHSHISSADPAQVNPSIRSQRSGVSTPSPQEQAESLSISKAHVQGVRQFMQSQLSALQQCQKSGTNIESSSLDSTRNRVKTTVELAEQAAIAKEIKKQQQKHSKLSHQVAAFHGNRNCMAGNVPQIIGTINRQPLEAEQRVRQQPPPRQSGSNIFASVEGSFQNSQIPSTIAQSSVLPSSDELLGSITGIDDTIINDLLQDSGLLANTFPDIEVDTSQEERGRMGSSYSQLLGSQTSARAGSGFQHTLCASRSMPATLCRVSTSGTYTSTGQMARPGQSYQTKAEIVSPSLHLQHQQQSHTTSMSSFSLDQQRPVYGNQLPSTHGSNHSPSLQNQQATVTAMEQARMDQIKEQMKQEDIPGEMCMDAANNATYRCIICSLAFETLDLLREHVRNVCKPGLQSSSVYTSKIEQDKANSARAGLETTTVFQCLRCFELCISEAGIKQHRLTCKRVPTVPSDIKKEAALSANKSKSRAGSSIKHSSVKAESISSSRPQSRNNTSVLSSHSSQKVSSTGLQSISSGSAATLTLGANYPLPVKSEPQGQSVLSAPRQRTPTPASSNAHSQHMSNPMSSASLPIAVSGRPLSNVSTLITCLPSSFAGNTQSSPLISFKHSEMSSPISSFQPPISQVKSSISVNQVNCAVNQNIKKEVPEAHSGLNPVLSNVRTSVPEPKNEFCPEVKQNCDASPKYSEISGSGGSKFLKCNLCSQTLCSSSSFIDHWKECAAKHKNVNKKKEQKEKTSVEPLKGRILENVMKVIESVASGSYGKSEELGVEDNSKYVMTLRDPCSNHAQDTASSVEGEAVDSEVSWDSRATFDNTTDSEMDKKCVQEAKKVKQRKNSQLEVILEKQSIGSAGTVEKCSSAKSNCETSRAKERTGSDEDEDDASLSGSESVSSAMNSTREALPKLRDRKLLKPIQSFINETFISPYQHVSKRIAKVMEENTVSESTTSGAESDEDHLLCRACKKPLQTQRLLLEHYVSKHLQPYTMKVLSDSSSYFCHLCQKTFSTFPLYMKHVPNHSSTIIQKMKIFNKSPRLSLHRDKIATQKGFCKTKKNSLSPKLAKALKSKKAATKSAANRIKRQMLLLQGQVPPERLKIMKRQRNNFRTSSEDDYSSDASNLMFRSKKPMMMIRGADGKWVKRKRGRPRKSLLPEDIVCEDQIETEESRPTSSPNTADEDNVASEDGSASPPSTRSRKRSGHIDIFESNSAKRRRHFSDSEGMPQQRKDAFLSELDTDSNSTTLSISVQENGLIIPGNRDKLKPKVNGETKINNLCEESCREKLGILNKLKVRSLSRGQKERLKQCDLNPSVILDALDLDGMCLPSGNASPNSEGATDGDLKNSTFLDSYLSYIGSYPQPKQKNSSKSSKSLRQSLWVTLNDLKLDQEKNKALQSQTPKIETEDGPSSSQSDSSWTYPVRRCSVNLGQKISLSDLEPETDEVPEEIESSQAIFKSGTPIVCLERNAEVESCVKSNISTTVVDNKIEDVAKTDSDERQTSATLIPLIDGSEIPENSPISSNDIDKGCVKDSNIVEVDSSSNAHMGNIRRIEGGSIEKNLSPNKMVSIVADVSSSIPKACSGTIVSSGGSSAESSPHIEVHENEMTSSSDSTLPDSLLQKATCNDYEKEGGEDDVLILEHSDDDEETAQELKDMVIVVNNDIEDDEDDDDNDMMINKEDRITSLVRSQEKGNCSKSGTIAKSSLPEQSINSSSALGSSETTSKPKINDSGLRDGQAYDSYVSEKDGGGKSTENNYSLGQENRCSDLKSEMENCEHSTECSDIQQLKENKMQANYVGVSATMDKGETSCNGILDSQKQNCEQTRDDATEHLTTRTCPQSHENIVENTSNQSFVSQNDNYDLTDRAKTRSDIDLSDSVTGQFKDDTNALLKNMSDTVNSEDVKCVADSGYSVRTEEKQRNKKENGDARNVQVDELNPVYSSHNINEIQIISGETKLTERPVSTSLSAQAREGNQILIEGEAEHGRDEAGSGQDHEDLTTVKHVQESILTYEKNSYGEIVSAATINPSLANGQNADGCLDSKGTRTVTDIKVVTNQKNLDQNHEKYELHMQSQEQIDQSKDSQDINMTAVETKDYNNTASQFDLEIMSKKNHCPFEANKYGQSNMEVGDSVAGKDKLINSSQDQPSVSGNIDKTTQSTGHFDLLLELSNAPANLDEDKNELTSSDSLKNSSSTEKDSKEKVESKQMTNTLNVHGDNEICSNQIESDVTYEGSQISKVIVGEQNLPSTNEKVDGDRDIQDTPAQTSGSISLQNDNNLLVPAKTGQIMQNVKNNYVLKKSGEIGKEIIAKAEEAPSKDICTADVKSGVVTTKTSNPIEYEVYKEEKELEKTDPDAKQCEEDRRNINAKATSVSKIVSLESPLQERSSPALEEAKACSVEEEKCSLQNVEVESDCGENCQQSSQDVLSDEVQTKQFREQEVLYRENSVLCNETKIAIEKRQSDNTNRKRLRSRNDTKANRMPSLKAIRNSHLSLAAFIAERLLKPQAEEPIETLAVSTSAEPQQDAFVLVKPEETLQDAPLWTKPKDILQDGAVSMKFEDVLQDDDVALKPQEPIQDSVIFSKPAEVLQDTAKPQVVLPEAAVSVKPQEFLQDAAVLAKPKKVEQNVAVPREPKEIVQDTDHLRQEETNNDVLQNRTSILNVGLVDYSCSSEENSRDGDARLAESEPPDSNNQFMSAHTLAESEPVDRSSQQMPFHKYPESEPALEGNQQTFHDILSEPQPTTSGDLPTTLPESELDKSEGKKVSIHTLDTLEKVQDDTLMEPFSIISKVDESTESESWTVSKGHDLKITSTTQTSQAVCKDRAQLISSDDSKQNLDLIPVDNFVRINLESDNDSSVKKPSDEPTPVQISNDVNDLEKAKEEPAGKKLQELINPYHEESKSLEDEKSNIESSSVTNVCERIYKEVVRVDEFPKSESNNDALSGSEGCVTPDGQGKYIKTEGKFDVLPNMKAASAVKPRTRPDHHPQDKINPTSPSSRKKVSLEAFSDTDDGDDLSSFELVIEKDTSSRNIVSFPEKRRDPSVSEEVKVMKIICQSYDSIEEKAITSQVSPKETYNPSPKKVLTGAKSLRKGGVNQFVWDDDSDEDGTNLTSKLSSSAKPGEIVNRSTANTSLSNMLKFSIAEIAPKKKAEEDSVLDAVNRKRKALREKTETAPFTWDLEEGAEKSSISGNMFLTEAFVKDSICTRETQLSSKKKMKTKVVKTLDVQRPNNLKVGKLSTKERKKERRKSDSTCSVVHSLTEAFSGSSVLIEKVTSEKTVDDNIQVDEEISFKRDSLPSTPTESTNLKSLEINTDATSNSSSRRSRKSGVINSNSSPQSKLSPLLKRQNGELHPQKQTSVRSRHNSMESNTSNKSDPASQSSIYTLKGRVRKSNEPHHQKAGLIKVKSLISPGAPDAPANDNMATRKGANTPKTRSSEAAIKAYNQKSLRNRGVNPVVGRKRLGDKTSTPRPGQKNKSSTGKAQAVSAVDTPGLTKTVLPLSKTTPKHDSKHMKRKSEPLSNSQGQEKKIKETVESKIKKKLPSELKSGGMNKAKPKTGIVKAKSKTISSVVHKAKTVSSALRKTKTASSVVGKAKTMSSVISKTKTETPLGKKSKVPLTKKATKTENKTLSLSNTKLTSKKTNVKRKNTNDSKKSVTKSGEKKMNHKK